MNGVRIPQDMLLAGYDDQKISEQLTPPLTSIQLPYSELGRLAVEYPVQSGRCRHARDAGGQAEGTRLKPRLR